jgi:hypothetical protein
MHGIRILFLFLAGLIARPSAMDVSVLAKPVKRGRNEGTAGIPASNVIGNGNISAYVNVGGAVNSEALLGDALVGGQIGIGGIMQLGASASVLNFQELGPIEAHLQITSPANDKLRFFGIALSGDLYLSTSLDTISFSADSSRPMFNPYLWPSVIADLDWLSKKKQLPLKTYLMVSFVDDAQLLFRYTQLAVKIGSEWKTHRNSLFADAGVSMYKEKRNKLNPPGDNSFEQFYVYLRPGGRYRIGNRISLTGALGVTFFQNVRENSGLDPEILSLSVKIEAPLYYRETNTEAIRTLVFMEQKEKKGTDSYAKNIESGQNQLDGLDIMLDGIDQGTETFDYAKEKDELTKRRMEIQDKMGEIEKILIELE